VAERAPLAANTTLSVDYLSDDELASRPAGWWSSVLGLVPFGLAPDVDCDPEIPLAPVRMQVLGAEASVFEVWRLEEPLRSGRSGLVHYRAGEAALFGRIVISEPGPEAANGGAATWLQRTTAEAYREAFAALERLGYPHLLRVWNYLAAINEETELGERYRQFNTARRRAFLDCRRTVEGDVPAACALGSESGSPLVIYFIATRSRSRAIENPRQVSAYHYPREYGPDSPIFSRAAIASDGIGEHLFISGTASIVGHRSIHLGDAAAQARESAANVTALVSAANAATAAGAYSPAALKYKVYVRHERDLPAIRAELASGLRAGHPITYLRADICRSELLVEIEAVGGPVRVARATRS
jgi:chorismate lyase / 3-hydroxybenzoate synthase